MQNQSGMLISSARGNNLSTAEPAVGGALVPAADFFLAEKAAAIHQVLDRMRKRNAEDIIEIGRHLLEVKLHVGEATGSPGSRRNSLFPTRPRGEPSTR